MRKRLTPQELKMVRIRLAVSIATQFPSLYQKVKTHKDYCESDPERLSYIILEKLLKCEPCIGHILEFYHERHEI